MEKKQFKKQFYENVDFIQRNIAPDDIYIFTEQTLMAAVFFLHIITKFCDLEEECNNNIVLKKYVANVLGFEKLKKDKKDVRVDMDLKSIEGDDDDDDE